MYNVCKALQRKTCFETLKAFDHREPSDTDTCTALITLLSAYHAEFSPEIVSVLRNQPNVYKCFNANCHSKMSLLQQYKRGNYPIAVVDINALTEAGADPELADMAGNNLLNQMMTRRKKSLVFEKRSSYSCTASRKQVRVMKTPLHPTFI